MRLTNRSRLIENESHIQRMSRLNLYKAKSTRIEDGQSSVFETSVSRESLICVWIP